MDERQSVLTDQFIERITQDPLVRRAGVADGAIDIQNADQIERVLDQRAIMLLAPFQRFHGARRVRWHSVWSAPDRSPSTRPFTR